MRDFRKDFRFPGRARVSAVPSPATDTQAYTLADALARVERVNRNYIIGVPTPDGLQLGTVAQMLAWLAEKLLTPATLQFTRSAWSPRAGRPCGELTLVTGEVFEVIWYPASLVPRAGFSRLTATSLPVHPALLALHVQPVATAGDVAAQDTIFL